MPYTQDHRSSIETNSTGAENPPESPSEKIFLKNFKNISENFAKTAPSIRDRSERGRKPTSRCMRGGEQLLELTPSQKKTVRHQFDSFCRKVLREEARDYKRHIAWRSDHEVSLSELSEEQERQMYVLDEYPSEQTHFHVQGYDVAIENEDLANALTVLPDDKRDIVLLAYTAVLLGNSSTLNKRGEYPPRCNRTTPADFSLANPALNAQTIFSFSAVMAFHEALKIS